ncbi:hypothetical protein SEVIR_8G220800v4 [Setaria viridis]|uniref:Uncharacterized protein n=1 Tax=Setaria viridis TaxID=4556 RepID=A0A4U6TI72_SETVI|nr:purine permease 1-like [Setaria viridis]TKW02071.1 hypothetical protein SEVIR_8G220800v2 [Setaria viridis]
MVANNSNFVQHTSSAVFGACFAIACFAYSLGSQSLPLSTSAVLQATQLAFNAIFAFLFAGLRFTPFSVNAVVLLSMGPAVLGARPLPEEHLASRGSWAYWAGFVECLISAAVLGLVLPLVQVTMSRGHGRRSGAAETAPPPPPSFAMVIQMQVLMGAAATVVSLWGFVSYLYGESLEKKMEAGEKEAESICSPLIVPCDF